MERSACPRPASCDQRLRALEFAVTDYGLRHPSRTRLEIPLQIPHVSQISTAVSLVCGRIAGGHAGWAKIGPDSGQTNSWALMGGWAGFSKQAPNAGSTFRFALPTDAPSPSTDTEPRADFPGHRVTQNYAVPGLEAACPGQPDFALTGLSQTSDRNDLFADRLVQSV
jgi:hypothetical protein